MDVDNVLFKGLRKYKGYKLADASSSICSPSALSQFESGKINLSSDNKLNLLKKYGVKFIPHKEDIDYLRDKVEILKGQVKSFYILACKKNYDLIIRREGYLYYDLNLMIDSYNLLTTYEILYVDMIERGESRLELLKHVEHLMTHNQRKEYYFNVGLLELLLNKDIERVEEAFNKSISNMLDFTDEFILYWYAYAMKYFGKKMLAIKYYQEVERKFMVNNNFLGIQIVLLDLAELFLIVEEPRIAEEYLQTYSEKRLLQKNTYAINDSLFYSISGQLALLKGQNKKAVGHFQNALKMVNDHYVKTDLSDYVHVSMLDTYKKIDKDKYEVLKDSLKNSYNHEKSSYLGAYFIQDNCSEKEYEDYINKVVIPNEYFLSNRNYSMILHRYKLYLVTKKRYSALTKIIL